MYTGMQTPQHSGNVDNMQGEQQPSHPGPAAAVIEITRPSAGHGALRDDDDDRTSFRNRISNAQMSGSISHSSISFYRGARGGSVSQRLSTTSLLVDDAASEVARGSTATVGYLQRGAVGEKKRSFYQRAELLGKEPIVPKYFLNATFRKNSFFARRLLRLSLSLATVMATGIGFYYFYKPHDLVLNPTQAPQSYGFMLHNPRLVYTFQANSCENLVGFSALIYHALPAVIVLALPASGLRFFEPFRRESHIDDQGNMTKIKRTLVYQACEMMAVLVMVFSMLIFLFFWYMFFNGGAFSCSIRDVQIFAVVSILCFAGLFAELRDFARFREHVKMQLGAFKESDQTGDVRKHVVDKGIDHLMNTNDKILSEIRKRLYNATRLGDLREMRKVLDIAKAKLDKQGFPMKFYGNSRIYFRLFGKSRKNPVHVAAYNGNIAALELLASYGFQLNTLDKFSRVRFSTGDLFWYFANLFITKPVVSEDTDAVSIFKTTLVTPLHCAVSTGQLGAVRWLIAHGAEVGTIAQSSYRSERVPPLFMAEHPDIVLELIEHGANHLQIPDPGFMNTLTVLQLAYLRENYAVAHVLEERGCDVALTPFHAAAAMNDVMRVRKFIRGRTPIDCLGEHGYIGMNRRTPLHWAAVNGALEVVELLLEAGADPNFQDARGRTPLHWAARLNRLDVVNSLLTKGSKPDLVDLDHMTPLMCAAYAKGATRELLTSLVSAGGDINYQLPTSGDTALHIAIRNENEDSALAILACGGNIMKMNMDGLRPLDCTTSTKLLFEIKRAAGHRDVMISYTHSHSEFAKKLRKSLEDANVTTWLDLMDPSGIGGGSVWREEIARGITNAALVVCILTEDYAQSEWCLKELALAKQVGTPILAVSTESVRIGEDLQVYLYTRQLIPFEPAITATKRNTENPRQIEYDYDDNKYQSQFRLLLDGVRDEIEKHRNASILRNKSKRGTRGTALGLSMVSAGGGFSKLFQPWEMSDAQFVFISHGDKHSAFVRQLYQELSDAGVSCYGDRNIDGQNFEDRIHAAQEAILKCTCFVVILSSQTMTSELVRDQLAFAEDKSRPIFPIILNDLELGLDKQYSLARNQLYHFMSNGAGFKHSFDRLLNCIHQHYRLEEVNNSTLIGENSTTSFVSFTSFGANNGGQNADPTSIGNRGGYVSNGMFTSFVSDTTYSGLPPPHEATTVIIEDGEIVNSDPSLLEPQHNSIRNFESISALEDEDGRVGLDLSSTHVRM